MLLLWSVSVFLLLVWSVLITCACNTVTCGYIGLEKLVHGNYREGKCVLEMSLDVLCRATGFEEMQLSQKQLRSGSMGIRRKGSQQTRDFGLWWEKLFL